MAVGLRRLLNRSPDDLLILRLAGLALPAAVWVIGILSPQRGGLNRAHLPLYTALLVALAAIEQTAPRQQSAAWRRLLWLLIELGLSFAVVRTYGPPVRPSLIFLVPAWRVVLMFGERWGLLLSLSAWLAYAIDISIDAWPNRLGQDLPNYLSFFLAPYLIAVVLTLATLRQIADRRRVEMLYTELSAAHEELKLLQQRDRETAVTQERNRLAREIHDTLAHYLTVINVQLEAADKLSLRDPAKALEEVRRARRLTVECLQEVRRSVAALRASTLDELSLPGALHRLATEFKESTGIDVQLQFHTPDVPDTLHLPAEVALTLYRVAQEGLTNVQRHAHATSVRLQLSSENGHIELILEDDGIGLKEAETSGKAGFGLTGLRERAELIGGQLSFGGGPSGGGRLTVVLPLAEQTGVPT